MFIRVSYLSALLDTFKYFNHNQVMAGAKQKIIIISLTGCGKIGISSNRRDIRAVAGPKNEFIYF